MEHTTSIDRIEHTILRRTMLPHLKIIFNFSLNTSLYLNVDATNQDPTTAASYNTTGYATFRESLSYDGVREAVRDGIGHHLDDGELPRVVERVWGAVRESFPSDKTLPKHTICSFDVPIRIRQLHYHTRMVPAADSSLAMLENYEFDCDQETERCCCICLEVVGGGGGGGGGGNALRMPCSHVFHGGCIKEWLRTSHYCPICRYEMPTD